MDFKNNSEVIFPITEKSVIVDGEVITDRKAICRADTDACLGIVGTRYKPLDNYAVMATIDKILTNGGIDYKIEEGFTRRNGAETAIEISFPGRDIKLKNGDTMNLRAYIRNSFDGGGAVRLETGFFRYWCSNLAMHGTKDHIVSIRHSSKVNKAVVEAFMYYISEKFNEAKNMIISLTQMAFMTRSEIEEYIMRTAIIANKYRNKLMDTWQDKYENSLSGWMLYNAFTEVISHQVKASQFGKIQMLSALSKEAAGWMETGKLLLPEAA